MATSEPWLLILFNVANLFSQNSLEGDVLRVFMNDCSDLSL